jgi:hypothetical protein
MGSKSKKQSCKTEIDSQKWNDTKNQKRKTLKI